MNKQGTKVFTLVMFLIAIAALGVFTYLSDKSSNNRNNTDVSEKDILLGYDMDGQYPKTARDAVVLHCRYMKYIYGEEFEKDYTEDDLFAMNEKMRLLYDEELLGINSPEIQLQMMKDEIALYKANKQRYVSYTPSEVSQIEYNTDNGIEYAKMRVSVAMTIDGASFSADEEYILRKDAEGKWKILGWQAINQNDTTEEGK